MSRAGKSFELGGVVVPITPALNFQQVLRPIEGGSGIVRMMSGRGVKQTAWSRKAVELSGDGWCPLGLGALDYAAPMTLKCGVPTVARSQSTTIALPTARRTDAGYEPFARAHLPSGEEVRTAISITSHIATLTPVAGAISYAVWYWPQLTVLASPPEETFDRATGDTSWTLTAEEE